LKNRKEGRSVDLRELFNIYKLSFISFILKLVK